MDSEHLIDWKRVEELWNEIGSEDFEEVAALFIEETGAILSQLNAPQERAEIQESLHFLKGSALNLGFQDLAKQCENWELEDDGDFAQLTDIFERSKAELVAGKVHFQPRQETPKASDLW